MTERLIGMTLILAGLWVRLAWSKGSAKIVMTAFALAIVHLIATTRELI